MFLMRNLHCRFAFPKHIRISECQWAAEKCIERGYIVYKFGEVCSGVPLAHFCTCVRKLGKIGIISEFACPILTKFSALIDKWVMMINLTLVLRSLNGLCYSN